MKNIIIELYKSDNDGHIHYNVYSIDESKDTYYLGDPTDGGIHTGPEMSDAIESACDMAKDVVAGPVCNDCLIRGCKSCPTNNQKT